MNGTRTVFLTALLTLLLTAPTDATAAKSGDYLHRDGNKTLVQLFTAELAAARAKKQGVVVVFSAAWCAPCKPIKEFLQESPVTRKLTRQGRILFIDVDEWRGPAHRLIAGVNPTKLPTIVRVDYTGKEVARCFGTELGLLSARAVGLNLKRLIDGKRPTKPAYESNPEERTALLRADMARQKAKHVGVPPVEVEVVSSDANGFTLRVVLRNQQAPRRWYVIPAALEQPLATDPGVTSYTVYKFADHVRAQFMRFAGQFGFTAIPVAGNGFVDLGNFRLPGPPSGGILEIWELNQLKVGAQKLTFDKKLPYTLTLKDATRAQSLRTQTAPPPVKLFVKKRYRVPIDP